MKRYLPQGTSSPTTPLSQQALVGEDGGDMEGSLLALVVVSN